MEVDKLRKLVESTLIQTKMADLPEEEKKALSSEKLTRLERAARLDVFLSSTLRQINIQESEIVEERLRQDFILARNTARKTIFWSNKDIEELGEEDVKTANQIMEGLDLFKKISIAIPCVSPSKESRISIFQFLKSISIDLQASEYNETYIDPPWAKSLPKKIHKDGDNH